MVNGEQLCSQPMIGLPFTDYCLPSSLYSFFGVSDPALFAEIPNLSNKAL